MKLNFHPLLFLLIISACRPPSLLPISGAQNTKKRTVAISGGVKGDLLKFALQDYLLHGTKECMMEVVSFDQEQIESIDQSIDSMRNSGNYWQRAGWGPKKYHRAFAQFAGTDHSIVLNYVLGPVDTLKTWILKEQDPSIMEWLFGLEKRVGWEPSYMLIRPLRKIKISYVDNHTGKKLWRMKKSVGPFTRIGNPRRLQKRSFDKFIRKFPYCIPSENTTGKGK